LGDQDLIFSSPAFGLSGVFKTIKSFRCPPEAVVLIQRFGSVKGEREEDILLFIDSNWDSIKETPDLICN